MRVKRIRKFHQFLENSKKRINLLYGSAGSGKSYAMAQFFVRRFYEGKDKRFLVLRKTLPSLRITAYKLILDLLREYNLPYHLNKTEMLLSFGTNEMLFKSLDDPEKIKSYEGNYLWIEEATEITHEDFLQLNLRLRRKTEDINQMYLTFNPISKLHWIYQELIEKERDDVAILHSTYKDNPFLSEDYIKELENLKDQDETYYQVYALGEWGVLQNIIYTNYDLIDTWPGSFDEVIYGLDFGYNNPSVLVEVRIKDKELYLRELLYQTHLTNEDLIEKLKELIPDRNSYIYADPAEPARIEEIARAGLNIHLADKSVKDGIDFVRRQKLHILKSSVNLIKEISGYKYKEDKDGNVLEEPVKFRDH
ncbi:MAG: PBSX family phage terminase large subunit [Candidatus Aenigmarchaeota archaeon]|nr:PBSX family phage terminase large subunit [Candidatus Aenigmarchaeota archaeon]